MCCRTSEDFECSCILQARKTLIKFDGSLWTKKNSATPFDVSMGSSDSAEVSDLVGLYLLNLFQIKFPKLSGGLYRDDALNRCLNLL